MTDKKKNGWIKFVPSLDLPKERVSIAYDTHDERGTRYAYGYFQFYNGTCGCFWKDGNEQPKVIKAEDIKYWMPVPSLDVQKESVSEDLEEAANNAVIALVPSFGQKYSDGSYVSSCRDSFKREELIELFKAGANWQERKDEKNIGELQWNAHAEGWDECKQEMMKDAIDTTIKQGCTELVILIKGLNEDKFSFGDKVKIIVVKEGCI